MFLITINFISPKLIIMDDDFLKYGDQILLYSDSVHGYISTIGFNAPKVQV